jgi:hypothetical protein
MGISSLRMRRLGNTRSIGASHTDTDEKDTNETQTHETQTQKHRGRTDQLQDGDQLVADA